MRSLPELVAPLPLLPAAAAPALPIGRITCSIATTVAFGLALVAVALPLVDAPWAALAAASELRPVVPPELVMPAAEAPDWS